MNRRPWPFCATLAVVIGFCLSFTNAAEMGACTASTWETIDYRLTNTTWSDNPFDLE